MTQIVMDCTEKEAPPSEPICCEICCFEDIEPENQTKCAVGHTFCKTCARNMAQRQIVNSQTSLLCMSMDGCEEEFEEEEAKKFLSEVLYKKWRILFIEKFAKELGIKDTIEFCPFCDFNRVAISISEAQTFICGSPNCGKWSCRNCKEEDHSPLSCEEAERILINIEDQKAKFIFELTVRRCPSKECGIPIEKSEGIKCERCGIFFCYLCRKDISSIGYSHFGASLGLCDLYANPDSTIAREKEAAEKEFEKISSQQIFVKERKQALKDAIVQAREREHERLSRQEEEEKQKIILQNAYHREFPTIEDMFFIDAKNSR